MSDQQESTVDSASRDLGGAIQMGSQAARSAKTIGKAAAEVSTGNVAGAAVTLAKDPESMKTLLILALIPLFALVIFTTVVLYALPNLMYDAATAYVSEVTEMYEQELYGGTEEITSFTKFSAALKVSGRVIADVLQNATTVVKSIWSGLTGRFLGRDESRINSRAGSGAAAKLTEDQLYQVYAAINFESVNLTIRDRIDTILTKADGRAQDLSDAIWKKKDAIDRVISRYYQNTYSQLIRQYDDFVWDGTDLYVNTENTISPQGAVKLLSLYTVQTDDSLQNMNLSSLMKWLGYYERTGLLRTETEEFTLSDLGVTCSVHTWQGTFLPQYLMEEMRTVQEETYWSAVSDMNMFDGLDRKERTERKKQARTDAWEKVEELYLREHGCSLIDLLMVLDCPTLSEIPVDTWVETIPVEDGPDIQILHAKATLQIDIYTRSLADLEWMVGLWEGPLPRGEAAG